LHFTAATDGSGDFDGRDTSLNSIAHDPRFPFPDKDCIELAAAYRSAEEIVYAYPWILNFHGSMLAALGGAISSPMAE